MNLAGLAQAAAAARSPASLPLAWVHPHRCFAREPPRPGEIRRTPFPGSAKDAFAYDFGCPSCGSWNTWLVRGPVPLIEGELVEVRPQVEDEEDRAHVVTLRPWRYPSTLDTEREVPCVGCKRVLTIRASTLSTA